MGGFTGQAATMKMKAKRQGQAQATVLLQGLGRWSCCGMIALQAWHSNHLQNVCPFWIQSRYVRQIALGSNPCNLVRMQHRDLRNSRKRSSQKQDYQDGACNARDPSQNVAIMTAGHDQVSGSHAGESTRAVCSKLELPSPQAPLHCRNSKRYIKLLSDLWLTEIMCHKCCT